MLRHKSERDWEYFLVFRDGQEDVMVKKQAVDVGKIRERLAMKKGRRVELYAIGERNRVTRAQGVLDGVYPGIFTILVDSKGYSTRYSYTYNELITGKVNIRLIG